MNMIVLSDEDYVSADTVCLTGRRLRHVEAIHRAQIGDSLRVGHLNGLQGQGTILELTNERLVLSVQCIQEAPQPCPIELILALPRPKVLKRVLVTATTLGIKHISLINAWRVEKSFWQTPLLDKQKIDEYLVEGLEQCRDTILPCVELFPLFKPFVEDVLPRRMAGKQGVVAHPHIHGQQVVSHAQSYVLAVGPEGGFIPYEVDALCSQGMKVLSLGERILKVETAVVSAVTRLELL